MTASTADASAGPDGSLSGRPAITSIAVRSSTTEVQVTVVLTIGSRVLHGAASGPADGARRQVTVARAALAAASELLPRAYDVESATVLTLGPRRVALCALTAGDQPASDHVLTGSAPLRGDESEAVSRAVLDALNRTLAG